MKSVKQFVEGFYEPDPFPLHTKLNNEWGDFIRSHPNIEYEVTGQDIPVVVRLLNRDNGEVRFLTVKKFDDATGEVTYAVDGKTLNSDKIRGYLVREQFV